MLRTRKFDNNNNHKGLGWSYSLVTVNGIRGMLIYPDGYSGSRPSIHNNFATIDAIYDGCAFLPCSGQRGVSSPLLSALPGQVDNPIGYYWAPYSGVGVGAITIPTAGSPFFEWKTDYPLYYGLSVRLVTDVQ